jgi:hypothetical protein
MQDTLDIIKNVETIYDSNTSFAVLKDFERVLDDLDLYVYANWEDGEIAQGPDIGRHWITCTFMWPRDRMPDPIGGKRLLDYDCKVKYKKDYLIVPRKIQDPDDYRPGTKKGKLDRNPIWLVEIQMPKKLIHDIYMAMAEVESQVTEPAAQQQGMDATQPADVAATEAEPAGDDLGGAL